MADIELVVKIDEKDYQSLKDGHIPFNVLDVIRKGIILPKSHGRLIDVDAIPEQIELKGFLKQDNAHLVTIDRVKEALDNTPTIVEADRSEDYD